jgi:hypothetical protein
MNGYYTWLALELARDRIREADARNRYRLDSEGLANNAPGLTRRALARAAASLSRASADVARRLDESVAADAAVRSSRLA